MTQVRFELLGRALPGSNVLSVVVAGYLYVFGSMGQDRRRSDALDSRPSIEGILGGDSTQTTADVRMTLRGGMSGMSVAVDRLYRGRIDALLLSTEGSDVGIGR